MSSRIALLGILVIATLGGALAAETSSGSTSCVACHGNGDFFEPEQLKINHDFRGDIHSAVGLSCHDCHGGDPDPALAENMDAAMDPDFAPNPYVGTPGAEEIPGFCGRCHSNLGYMRRFKPDARVDQESEYWTSQHGQALQRGDSRVATCVSCHGIHGILSPSDPASPVYPTHVGETCRSCHGSAEQMEGATRADGLPLPIDQYARWRQSVHAKAMFEKEDLSAPTCNDCHGNHGASPPGLDSINFVCGQCHGREADLFRNSAKREAFEAHNELLAEAGENGCAACHESPEPQAGMTQVTTFGECTSCHGNHGIMRPTLAMLSPPPPTPCELCHMPPTGVEIEIVEPEKTRQNHETARDALMIQADRLDLEGESLFNWLVDQALQLPEHTGLISEETGEATLRPEFARLWAKFRIGKTTYLYEDPTTGEPVEGRVIRCDTCHAAEAIGMQTSQEIMRLMHELTSATAASERVLLRAKRGGVETREALLHIEQAVDAQIELEVLTHAFELGEDSEFTAKHREGIEHALAGFAAGGEALDELAFRRKGLVVSLVIIVLVLLGLGLKIRQISSS